MKKGTLKRMLLCIVIVFLLPVLHTSRARCDTDSDTEGRILFISSYSYAWDTVQIQIEGIKEGISSNTTVDYEFMDTKRFTSEEHLQMFYEGLKYRLENVEPYDVVILGDDAALMFALEHRDELFPDIPIIFEGINNEELAVQAAEDPLITGILEKLSFEKNIEFARTLYPKATKVVGILDNSITGEAERTKFYQNAELYPELEFTEINTSELTSDELKDAIASVDTDSILIYVVMTEDADGVHYTNAQSIQLISEYAKVPAFRMVSGGIGEGLLGGNIVSMELSGKIAAEIATKIINGTSPAEFDVVVDSPNIYCIDETVMKKFNLDLSLIPEGAEIVNHEESFWEHNKEAIIPAVIIILLLILIMIISLYDNVVHRRLSKELRSAKQNLENAYYHDYVTGIPNRTCFKKDLETLSQSSEPFALIMLDIDNFKKINDNYGHSIGDEALHQIGLRLKNISTDYLTAYRFAGDEFIVIVKQDKDDSFLTEANACLDIFRKTFDLQGLSYPIHCSMGIALYPRDTQNTDDLIVYADLAMYKVKKASKNAFCFYHELEQ
ncbi:MAG: ABC transporter substrate binding protein [Lachnospiraceae bacterium]|nr:ABC transporter substrate binding protein [Lachnospiraceae bacterium]